LVLGSKEQNELDINLALNLAVKNNGPVHINIPFNEPLYNVVDELTVTPKIIDADEALDSVENMKEFITSWNASKKKMILVGVNQPNQIEQQWLDVLANNDSIIVFTETTSNLHHAGGMIVSKKVKAFLRTYKPEQHWHVDTKKANDTFFSLSEHIKVTPNYFLSKLLPKAINKRSEYKPNWNTVKTHRSLKHDEYIAQIEFSDLKVFDYLLKALPDHSILQLGNSSAVRYAQLFNLNQSLEVFCNRGTSGIDGSTATAIGSAIVNNKQTTLITGDLSFLYDSNALWNNYIPKSFRIIVINNGGGGIFRILPGHKDTENFDKYFETNHNLTAQHLCKMYGFEYSDSENMDDLFEELNSFFLIGNKPKLLEIFTPRKVNDSILLDYFKRIK
jgi:2-succinyl-5-enolpyruvyl-6-hydroxy-3-cyclohexene-1-carboxylate synthase